MANQNLLSKRKKQIIDPGLRPTVSNVSLKMTTYIKFLTNYNKKKKQH